MPGDKKSSNSAGANASYQQGSMVKVRVISDGHTVISFPDREAWMRAHGRFPTHHHSGPHIGEKWNNR